MKRLLSLVAALATLVFAAGARADAGSATHYYLSLGDSLAAGTNAAGDGAAFTNLGYADQHMPICREFHSRAPVRAPVLGVFAQSRTGAARRAAI
jgi:hypothetical protein